jgi:hypothetical protein
VFIWDSAKPYKSIIRPDKNQRIDSKPFTCALNGRK